MISNKVSYIFDERQNVIDKLEVVKGERVRGKKILLVDDLFTTGATVKAMIKLLKPYNPKKDSSPDACLHQN